MRERLVSRELNPLLTTLPDKFSTIYDYQIDAIDEIVSAYDDGYKVVALEAPTGSGKTLIAECVRRMIGTRATYVCHNKELQAQFARDFPTSRVLYGRANYTPNGPRGLGVVSCDDCTFSTQSPSCSLCNSRQTCPYVVAKDAAIHSPIPVLNSAYWLSETMGQRSRFANTGLCIMDEADTLENVLMGQVEVYVSGRSQREYGIRPPERLTKQGSYLDWAVHSSEILSEPLRRLAGRELPSIAEQRKFRRVSNLYHVISLMKQDLERELPWVYDGDAGRRKNAGETIRFKPVKVDRFGVERVWSKDKRFLLMSSTLPDITLSSLGWTDEFKRVRVESQFHAKNRQVVVRPVANMSRKTFNANELESLNSGIQSILSRHEGERVLIHSVSYMLRNSVLAGLRDGRPVFTYESASGRARAIREFKSKPGAVLLAPGLERGVDLPDDLCRAQVILKVPYLSLGDKQVTERLYNTPDGKVWYNQHVASTIIQMVGRGVRSKEDYCVCYVLDKGFVEWYKGWGHLLPKWFRLAIRIEY
eukprot:gnl/Spiro4/26564_TR13229_c0_g2_i1.p1 gnl/Spiro4/26564_TR13229_c0_g2~~gnl/Spiro4/26564_TR13229_c0_g2_i1.p1  ORF type:complete len:533 (+),score=-104.66 gnl/Spiro4/26564_TR13229_c0_g2_i1:2377-3975(+)